MALNASHLQSQVEEMCLCGISPIVADASSGSLSESLHAMSSSLFHLVCCDFGQDDVCLQYSVEGHCTGNPGISESRIGALWLQCAYQ